jgi:hypothetical protein
VTLPFTGIATFAEVPSYDPAESPAPHAATLGIPTDEATTQHPGARYGPRAIREASTQFPYYKRWRPRGATGGQTFRAMRTSRWTLTPSTRRSPLAPVSRSRGASPSGTSRGSCGR